MAQSKASNVTPIHASSILGVGTVAPNFTLHVTPDQTLTLSDLLGQPVILAFYPADWSPVCGDQMAVYNEILPEFRKFGAELLGVSVDGSWCHGAFAEARHLHFPLLADFEPKGGCRPAIWRLPRCRWLLRTRSIRHRQERNHRLELLLARCCESGSRRHSAGVREFAQITLPTKGQSRREQFMATLKVAITAEDHAQGSENAEVTLVEYGDYECPHCGRAYPIVQQVQRHFGKRLRVVFRNFPLSEMHPHAEAAAEAAEFAGSQGKFWEMHDRLFENQARLGEALFLELGERLELSASALLKALKQGTFEARVRADFKGGVRSGVNGTPTFFINGHRHDGSFDFETLIAVAGL